MDIGYDEVDPELDPANEQGREDINDNDDETEADIDRNQRSQEQTQRELAERTNDVRIRGMREAPIPTEVLEMFDYGSRLNEDDMKLLGLKPREKSRYLEWFNRARSYLREKGVKFKEGMALAFFRRQGGYERLPDAAGAGEDIPMVDGSEDVGEAGDGDAAGTSEALARREEENEEAWKYVSEKFPEMKKGRAPFFYRKDGAGNVEVRLTKSNSKWHAIDNFDKKGFPKTILEFLGKEREEVIGNNEDIVNGKEEEKERLRKTALDDNEDAETRANAVRKAMQLDDEIERLNWEREKLERTMSIKDRVKRIFKKYGFTVAAIVSSVGIIIGAVVSNLKAGLGKIAMGMGNGLKALGKKLGQVLPGIAGAIASFIFKTAGEVIGFLGKNAWLLIVAVVLYAVDQIKRKQVKHR